METIGRFRTPPAQGNALSWDGQAWVPAAGAAQIKSSTGRAGLVIMAAGSATIACITVTANTVCQITRATSTGTPGTITYVVTPGVGVVLTSTNGADAGVFSFLLIELI